MRCTGGDRSWVHGRAPRPRASTSTLCAAHVGVAHGPTGESTQSTRIHEHHVRCTGRNRSWSMGEQPIHEHPQSFCALNTRVSIMGPGESTPSTSIREHPVHCTGKGRAWVHGRAPHPRATTSTLCAAQVGIAHGAHGRAPRPRASTSTL